MSVLIRDIREVGIAVSVCHLASTSTVAREGGGRQTRLVIEQRVARAKLSLPRPVSSLPSSRSCVSNVFTSGHSRALGSEAERIDEIRPNSALPLLPSLPEDAVSRDSADRSRKTVKIGQKRPISASDFYEAAASSLSSNLLSETAFRASGELISHWADIRRYRNSRPVQATFAGVPPRVSPHPGHSAAAHKAT